MSAIVSLFLTKSCEKNGACVPVGRGAVSADRVLPMVVVLRVLFRDASITIPAKALGGPAPVSFPAHDTHSGGA